MLKYPRPMLMIIASHNSVEHFLPYMVFVSYMELVPYIWYYLAWKGTIYGNGSIYGTGAIYSEKCPTVFFSDSNAIETFSFWQPLRPHLLGLLWNATTVPLAQLVVMCGIGT